MHTLFISDIHLCESNSKTTALFLKFLKEQATQADAFYILGDLFNVWIGDDNQTEFNRTIIAALHQLVETGVPTYLMHGNRDFLIGRRFLKETACQLLKDPTITNLYNIPILIMHGDLLCTHDKKYMKFRKQTRNWFFQKLFLIQSLKKRKKIAERYREKSKAYLAQKDPQITDVAPEEVIRIMKQYHVNYLIHGHTHRPAMHHFDLNGKNVTRAVLGPWVDSGNALVVKPKTDDELDIQYVEFY